MQSNQRRIGMFSLLLSSIFVLTILAAPTLFAEKQPKDYPEEGKITGSGQNEHAVVTGGGRIDTMTRRVYTHLYTVQTDTKIYQLDCVTKKECGGDKKFEIGDMIHFRVEKGKAYASVTDGGKPSEQKLLVLNEQLRPDAKAPDAKPADAQPSDTKQ
jgi:hypothetical protein